MPSPPGNSGGLSSGVGFDGLVRALTEEHERVIRERDDLRMRLDPQRETRQPVHPAQRFGVCMLDPVGDHGREGVALNLQPPAMDEKLAVAQPGPRAFSVRESVFVDGATGDGDEPQTPRQLRGLHGRFQKSATCGSFSNHATSRRTNKNEAEALQLHTQWVDLYVANQLQVEIMDSDAAPEPSRGRRGSHGSLVQRSPTLLDLHAFNRWDIVCLRIADYLVDHMGFDVRFKPHDRFRVFWDVFAGILVLYDTILIPVQLAWDLNPTPWIVISTLCFWVVDIFLNFNTAVVMNGDILASRKVVAKCYVSGRFWFDLLLVLLDIVILAQPPAVSGLAWLRGMRGIRGFRILRALRLAQAQEKLEELFVDFGVDQMLLVLAVSQTLGSIFLMSHFWACGWYLLGQQEELGSPGSSWLSQLAEQEVTEIQEAYAQSLYWTLGHLTANQINPQLRPLTYAERVFTLSMICLSLIIVAANISKMTNAIAEIQRANMEATDTRRKLAQVLRAANADVDLSARIMRFGMYVFRRKASHSLQSTMKGLLSSALASELTLSERSPYIQGHPFFSKIRQAFPNVYVSICEAFVPHVYADADVIFREGNVAECLYVTIRGEYILDAPACGHVRLADADFTEIPSIGHLSTGHMKATEGSFTGLRFLCEASLFAQMVLRTSLRTQSFADALTLSSEEFAACVAKSPKCVAKVYQYAAEFIRGLNRRVTMGEDVVDIEWIPVTYARAVIEKLEDMEWAIRPVSYLHDSDSGTADMDYAQHIMDIILDKSLADHNDLARQLPRAFPELRTPDGSYDLMNMQAERKRARAAMMSVIWLVQDRHDLFTACQPADKKLSERLWEDLQSFIKWADLSPEMIRAMLVFLAIRGIGKSPALLRAMNRDSRTPEGVLQKLMSKRAAQIPSFGLLADPEARLLESAIEIHKTFNFAQMLQGENVPYHLAVLQDLVRTHGTPVFKFYLVSLVGVMCGLAGTETCKGSLFMNQTNGATLIAGISALKWLETSSPPAIYWSYIRERAAILELPFEELEDMAMARLACLTRATREDLPVLHGEWARMSRPEREYLTRHLVEDGLQKPIFVLTFLPAFLSGANKNRAVGLYRAFLILIELMETLSSNGYLERSGRQALQVNLQDLADFVQTVESPRIFMALPGYVTFVYKLGRLDCIVSPKHKERAGDMNWSDDPTSEMCVFMRRMERRVMTVSADIERLQQLQDGGNDQALRRSR